MIDETIPAEGIPGAGISRTESVLPKVSNLSINTLETTGHTASTLSSFHKFPDLSLEMRRVIWRYTSYHPRILTCSRLQYEENILIDDSIIQARARFKEKAFGHHNSTIDAWTIDAWVIKPLLRAIFHTNQESRAELLAMYKESNNSHVNYMTDSIYLPCWNDKEITNFDRINGLVHLILRDLDGRAAIHHHVEAFKEFLLTFPKLESIVFVLDAGSGGPVAYDEKFQKFLFECPQIGFDGLQGIADRNLIRKFQEKVILKTMARIYEPEKCPIKVKVRLARRVPYSSINENMQ